MAVYFKGSKVAAVINVADTSSSGSAEYTVYVAELPGVTITVNDESQTTNSTNGGLVSFSISDSSDVSVSAGDAWSVSGNLFDISEYDSEVDGFVVKGRSLYDLSAAEIHTACQNRYFHHMFNAGARWNFVDSSSIVNGYDFFVEKIEVTEGSADIVHFRLCEPYSGASYNINPQVGYLASSTATSFTTSNAYSNLGGYKYSYMRTRFMKAGEEVYTQATGIKPDDSTITTGIPFSGIYYTDGGGTTSSLYTYDYTTDTFTASDSVSYFTSYSTLRTGIQFVKGYFKSVGTIADESTFSSGYYYTYASYVYTLATTYSSSTTYYGFYETIQEDGVFLSALSSLSDYLVQFEEGGSTGNTQDTYASTFKSYCDIPCLEEMTGLNASTIVDSRKTNSATTTASNLYYSAGVPGEGEFKEAYTYNLLFNPNYSYWTRSSCRIGTNYFVCANNGGCFNGNIGYNPGYVRLGFRME